MSSTVDATGLGLFLYRPVAWCFIKRMKYLSILVVFIAILLGGCVEKEVSDGTKIVYREDGSKRYEIPYVNGKKNGTLIEYLWNGTKERETPYVDGKRHGTALWYFKDGSSKTSAEWVHNTGTVMHFYEDGPKKSETPHVDGKMHGTKIYYRRDGWKWAETVYENGKRISLKQF